QRPNTYRSYGEHRQRDSDADYSGADWAQEASRVADTAREYASSVGKAVSDTAADYATAASGYAEGTRQKIVEQSKRVADQVQGRVRSLVQDQPLAVALASLAAGAAVAVAFPATTWERQTLGAAGRRVSEAAHEKISEATSAAG